MSLLSSLFSMGGWVVLILLAILILTIAVVSLSWCLEEFIIFILAYVPCFCLNVTVVNEDFVVIKENWRRTMKVDLHFENDVVVLNRDLISEWDGPSKRIEVTDRKRKKLLEGIYNSLSKTLGEDRVVLEY